MASHSTFLAFAVFAEQVAASNLVTASNRTGYEEAYVSGPNTRGTVSLLTSCILTFIVCTWTAVHPDIIPYQNTQAQVLCKLGWMVKAALLPEGVVLVAFLQWTQARQVLRTWQEHYAPDGPRPQSEIIWVPGVFYRAYRSVRSRFRNPCGPSEVPPSNLEDGTQQESQRDWLGMSGAFFVVMGGFVVKHDSTIKTITPKAFEKLVGDGTLDKLFSDNQLTKSNFHHSVFKDKGKADTLAKCLVCLQILWMFAECIGRKIQGLPITLLEYHVMLQVIFTLISYLFWLHKPLDVGVPITLPILPVSGSSTEVMPALKTSTAYNVNILGEYSIGPECGKLFDYLPESPNAIPSFRDVYFRSWCDLSLVCCRSTLDRSTDLNAETLLGVLLLMIDASANGASHAGAWNYDFPTSLERNLYRASCIASIVIGIAACLLFLEHGIEWHMSNLFYRQRFAPRKTKNWSPLWGLREAIKAAISDGQTRQKGLARSCSRTFIWVWFVFYAFLFFVYYAAMCFLAVEAVISVRALPKGSFETVAWAEMVPHF